MHYRNGREAKNGDTVVSLANLKQEFMRGIRVGVLHDAKPGNDYCNGYLAPTDSGQPTGACLCDCLHIDDFIAVLAEKGLDKRPPGK